jgi:hypothetical protein
MFLYRNKNNKKIYECKNFMVYNFSNFSTIPKDYFWEHIDFWQRITINDLIE